MASFAQWRNRSVALIVPVRAEFIDVSPSPSGSKGCRAGRRVAPGRRQCNLCKTNARPWTVYVHILAEYEGQIPTQDACLRPRKAETIFHEVLSLWTLYGKRFAIVEFGVAR